MEEKEFKEEKGWEEEVEKKPKKEQKGKKHLRDKPKNLRKSPLKRISSGNDEDDDY